MNTVNIRKHFVISGVGRCGTTFMVRLLTELGLATGFKVSDLEAGVNPVSKAGLEFDLRDADCPYIVKSPWLCCHVEEILSNPSIHIEHVLIPMRDLFSAAESRRRVTRESVINGGLWLTESLNEGDQEAILAQNLYCLINALTEHEIPFSFLSFPRLAEDAVYLYEGLGALVAEIPFGHFQDAFNRVRRPEWIGVYTSNEVSNDC